MTRGHHRTTVHLVASTLDEARKQWIDTFTRDRADLGPAHAADRAAEEIDRYGPQLATAALMQAAALNGHLSPEAEGRHAPPPERLQRGPSIGR